MSPTVEIAPGITNELVTKASQIAAQSCGIALVDAQHPEMPLVYVNDEFLHITGYSRQEVLGRNCRFLQGNDRNQPVLDEIRAAIAEKRECTVLLRNYRKDGELFWNQLTLSPLLEQSTGHVSHYVGVVKDGSMLWDELFMAPIMEEDGTVTYYIGLQSDVTARETARQQVIEKQKELEEANAKITILNSQLTQENLRLGAEIEITRQLQEMILPRADELEAVNELDIAGYMEPADEVGGDYYDVLSLDGAIKIGIGDVTDHGLESGVVMLMTQTAVRTLLNSGETDPVRFLDVLNRTVYGNINRMQTDRNLTLSLVDYVGQRGSGGEMRLSGQHEEMIVIRKNKELEIIETADLGFPIGLDDDVAAFFDSTTTNLEPGDGVILFTDGITEAENMQGEYFGLERLCQSALDSWSETSEQIKDKIITDLHDHIGAQEVFDDITLLVIKQN